jgi:hypothetical protein
VLSNDDGTFPLFLQSYVPGPGETYLSSYFTFLERCHLGNDKLFWLEGLYEPGPGTEERTFKLYDFPIEYPGMIIYFINAFMIILALKYWFF